MFKMSKNGCVVFHTDRRKLEALRKKKSELFKGAHIQGVIQLFPSNIDSGVIYEEHSGKPVDPKEEYLWRAANFSLE